MTSAARTAPRIDATRVDGLSMTARRLTRASAALSFALGLFLFVAPGWSAERFAWSVTPFMTMTIGAWCLGNGVVAWEAARLWRWGEVYPLLVYLWAFAIGELAVLVRFNDLIPFDAALTWPYLAVTGVMTVAAVVGIVDAIRLRPSIEVDGPRVGAFLRIAWATFAMAVGGLGLVLVVHAGGARGSIFPEPMTSFTLKAFGVFYLALGVAAATATVSRGMRTTTVYASRATSLTALITVASLVFLGRFDLGGRPTQWIYLGAYLGALAVASVVVWRTTSIERRAGRTDARV